MNYNQKQQEILAITSGENIVNAPAGCGKTEVLTIRIKKALEKNMNPSDMICLTFTNRAASEMNERLCKELKVDSVDELGVFVGNIHRFCSKFLHENRLIPSNATLLDEVEYKSIIKGIINKFQLSSKVIDGEVYKYLADKKRENLGLNKVFEKNYENVNKINEPNYLKIYNQYESVKASFQFIDFDDLLSLTTHFLKDNNEYELDNFDWIQIDEVQDLNESQWEIVKCLTENAECKVYFGDYEQSIFSFMGSARETFMKFLNSIPKENRFRLDENYRSSAGVISILNDYLKEVIGSKDEFTKEKSEEIDKNNFKIITVEGTVEDEIENTTRLIESLQQQDENLAVLFRTNLHAEKCSTALDNLGIEHLKVSGFDFFQSKTIKDLMAFMGCLINEFDILAWTRILANFTYNLTLEEARRIIYKLIVSGVLPSDILAENYTIYTENFLSNFNSKRVVVFDTETTGLNPLDNDIIQIAATEIENGVKGESFEVYLKTNKDVGPSEKVHHISKATLDEKGLEQAEGLAEFLDFIGEDSFLVAHNLSFDISMLEVALNKYSDKKLSKKIELGDSLTLSKLIHPKFKSYKLEFLLQELNLEGVNSHNAADDVDATVNLLLNLVTEIPSRIKVAKEAMEKLADDIKRFKSKFQDLFIDAQHDIDSSKSVTEFIREFVVNSKNAGDIENPKFKAFFKLIEKEEDSCKGLNLRQKLTKTLPTLSQLSEIDLITEETKIVIATPYKAKGLGFDNVIICEVNDGVYPSFYSKTKDQKEEDMRVLYVALSRAKKRIYVSNHTKFMSKFGTTYERKLSEFIEPIKERFVLEKC